MVTIRTTSLTLTNSTFCPHSVFMCFVCIWEQTAIISLYNINWLVFITETECVYCAVRTGYIYIYKSGLNKNLRSAHTLYVFCVHLRTNSDLCHLRHKLIGFYSRDGVCLQRGTDCVFIYIYIHIYIYIYKSGLNKNLRSARTLYLCVLCASENKQRLFPYTALTVCFYSRYGVCLQRGTDWVFIYIYKSGLNKNLRSAHTVFMCFVCIWEQTATCATYGINWLVFIAETECVYCAVRAASIYIYIYIYNSGLNKNLRSAHTVFMCFMWISEQTAIISLYSINWLVFITEMKSVYSAVRTGALSIIQANIVP